MALDVLIADSSAAVRQVLHRVLRQAGVRIGRVHEAADGLEALEKLRAERIELVLAGIDLPNLDGLELLAQIKANPERQHLPVVMVAGTGNESKVLSAAQLGAVGYVCKPFTVAQIQRALSGLI